ncbi:response regulator transcription factor [Nocardia sp. CDC159]|uniref:Response regulator transcription factor n=1 Tax=Nocardia pulmonis TaxID=2951408 RepID=A0A9X2E0F0_9NOCA|nr:MULTISPECIES: response regulator transcription factor [Nocardia]MCM6771882.1 response regulator transcription factor [Nocardia pulmonis]MCM6785460.1 response regulator transcription factor [Nocardia sp. CDC159]
MINVLVVDDEPLVRGVLAALIRASDGLRVIGEAADGAEAVDLVAAHRPDVVLMDIRMPGTDGIVATERILATSNAHPLPRVLILTTFDLDAYVYAALRAGASGFLLKEASPEQVLSAIRAVATGDMLIAPTVTRRLIEKFACRTSPPGPHPNLAALTAREMEILRLVGTGISNTEIATRLRLSEGTVKTHVYRMTTKLGLRSRAQAVVVAYETGLVTPGGTR